MTEAIILNLYPFNSFNVVPVIRYGNGEVLQLYSKKGHDFEVYFWIKEINKENK